MTSRDLAGEGVRLPGNGPWLKWHMLRRCADDTPFGAANLERGLELGAFLEVDLRRLACGHFVCLHDPELESETTGRGPVADARGRTGRPKLSNITNSGRSAVRLAHLTGGQEVAGSNPVAPNRRKYRRTQYLCVPIRVG